MRIVVSPYHLTTREAPALAALQLAERVVTMMPTPRGGVSRRRVEEAVGAAPRYLELMESWRWSAALWEAGVIERGHEGADAAEDVRAAFERIAGDERYAGLRPFMKAHVFDDEREYLQAVASDVLRGGPDPAISVPVAAGLDRFAARHRLAVARATPTSISQKVEAKLGERVGAFAVPMLCQASAERILMMREELEDALEELREAMAGVGPGATAGLEKAARRYASEFESKQAVLKEVVDPDEPRVVVGTVAVSLVVLPAGAVLESSLAAVGALAGGRRRRVEPVEERVEAGVMPAVWNVDESPVMSVVVRVIGKS